MREYFARFGLGVPDHRICEVDGSHEKFESALKEIRKYTISLTSDDDDKISGFRLRGNFEGEGKHRSR